jgi:apolipoprotein N-acyltransferase
VPAPLGFLAWFAFLPLLAALEARVRAGAGARSLFALGYAFGLAFYLIGIHWIALLSAVAITVPWLKYPAWILAAAYLALFGGLTTLLAGVLARRASLALTFPCAFLVIEELRASGEMGFPWFQPGYTQHEYPRLIQMASLGSVSLVTLWVLALNVLIWRALRGTSRMRSALGALLVFALPWVWGQRVLDAAPKGEGPVVALVQGNIPGEIKWSGQHQGEILKTFLDLSQRAAGTQPRPALIVWPETATGSYLRKQLDQAIAVSTFTSRTGVPVFSGFADYGARRDGRLHQYNAAGLFLPDGSVAPIYAKRHLVPFGERMPFERFVPALGRVQLGQAEWTPGDSAVHFPSAAGPFTCLICFESIFPDLARGDVRSGARWLVNITNDEWFGNSAALYQHAAMASFRAVENHVPLARCANTGLSVMIDAYGRVRFRVPVFQDTVLTAALSAPGPPTLYTRVGDWPGVLALVAVVLLALLGARAALTARAPRG